MDAPREIAGKQDLPPKSVKAQLIRLDDHLKRIERTHMAGIQRAPGSLPVLEAFQTFLEHERRKTRRQLAVWGIGSLVLIAVGLGIGGFLLHAAMRNGRDDIATLSRQTAELETRLAGGQLHASEALTALDRRFSEENRILIEQYQGISDAQTALREQILERDDNAGAIRRRLEQIEARNIRLQAELEALSTAHLKAVAQQAGTTSGDHHPATRSGSRETDDGASPTTVSAVERPEGLWLTIVPEGQSQGIRWQIPQPVIPE